MVREVVLMERAKYDSIVEFAQILGKMEQHFEMRIKGGFMLRNKFFVSGLAILCVGLFVMGNFNMASGGMFDVIKGKADSKRGSSNFSRADIDGLYKSVSGADNLLQKSVNISFNLLSNKDEIQQVEMRQKEIENIKDPKEKEAEMRKVQEDKMASVEKSLEKEETNRKVQELDEQQKQLLVKAIYNIVLAGLMDTDAVERAKDLSQKIKANPSASMSYAGDLPKITEIITKLPAQVQKIFTLGNSLQKLASANKIEATLPQTASEKPKDVDI